MELNNVVLPDPLGPIRPTISPSLTWSDIRSFAGTPPNRLDTLRRSNLGIIASTGPIRRHRQVCAISTVVCKLTVAAKSHSAQLHENQIIEYRPNPTLRKPLA